MKTGQQENNEHVELVAKFRDLLVVCLSEYVANNPQVNLAAPMARENLATFIAAYVSPVLEEHEDEINSLRFMLDEMHNSQKALSSPEFQEEINDSINNHLLLLKIMQNNRGDA